MKISPGRPARVGSVLLAAGRGERLRPLTDFVPKPALPVGNRPLGSYALEALRRATPPVVVSASWLPDALVDALDLEPEEVLVESPEPYGTAGTLYALQPRLAEPVLTCNADLLSDLDPAALLTVYENGGFAALLAVTPVTSGADLFVEGVRARRFVDRRARPNAPGQRFIGMAVWGAEALKLLPAHRPAGIGETLIRPLVEQGRVAVHVHDGYVLDVGTPESYERARRDAEAGMRFFSDRP